MVLGDAGEGFYVQNTNSQNFRALEATSDEIKMLNLRKGVNTISYAVYAGLQGEQQVQGKIYFWDYNTKIVISDVDGTITKSDVLG